MTGLASKQIEERCEHMRVHMPARMCVRMRIAFAVRPATPVLVAVPLIEVYGPQLDTTRTSLSSPKNSSAKALPA